MIKFFAIWVAFTLAEYHLGPTPFKGQDDYLVALYVLLCFCFFLAGSQVRFALPNSAPVKMQFLQNKLLGYGLILVFSLTTYVQILSVTGKSMLDPSAYSLDFGDIYGNFIETAAEQQRGVFENIVTFFRMLSFPFCILFFVQGVKTDRVMAGFFLMPFIASSFLRGTDKELADVGILVGVALYYHRMLNKRLIWLTPLLFLFFFLFQYRRVERFGGFIPACLPDNMTCFNFDSVLGQISPTLEVTWVFFVSYTAQGYTGLHLAYQLPFEFNWGIGHLPVIKSILCKALRIGCEIGDYQTKMPALGWDTRYQWTSVYPIIANDFTLWLTPFYFLWIGVAFKVNTVLWRVQANPIGLCSLILIFQFFLFSSANMQMAVSAEWATCTVLFLYLNTGRMLWQTQFTRPRKLLGRYGFQPSNDSHRPQR